LTNQIPRYLPR